MTNQKLIFNNDGTIKTIILFNEKLSPKISLN